jgi:uncharacterized protein YyaL (SSP411 family)
MRFSARLGWWLCVAATGCAAAGHQPASVAPSPPSRLADLSWAELNADTFARAAAEGRILLIDGSAEWCHWCHVMDATTYRDPAVRRLLAERFLPVRVDIDSRPDFEERYGDWGWPATVLMTANGEEIGKHRGYMPPAVFLGVLQEAAAATPPAAMGAHAESAPLAPWTEAQRSVAAAGAQRSLDEYWDAKQGGWGMRQKSPLYWNNAWALTQARGGDGRARERVLFSLAQQRKIIDPVWGGICQYSTDGDWDHPHFEKLAVYQAGAIDNYASAFGLTGDDTWLATARLVRGFVDRFLTGPDGAFYTTMDADLNAHDSDNPLVSGRDYYAKGDAARRALGVPRIDAHEYGSDNGQMIAAYVTFGEMAHDPTAIAIAERAAERISSTHGTALGGIGHADADDAHVLYLADNAAFGFALVRLYEATQSPKYLDEAKRIADFMLRQLEDPAGGFLASTPDPTALGVLAVRRKPSEDNAMAIRFLAHLSRVAPAAAYKTAIARALPVVGSPEAIDEQGRMLGELLLAFEESRSLQ